MHGILDQTLFAVRVEGHTALGVYLWSTFNTAVRLGALYVTIRVVRFALEH